MITEPTTMAARERRFGGLGLSLAAAGGFLAGVLLVAVLGGAKPVVEEHTVTVASRPHGIAVPRLVGVRLDVAHDRLDTLGLKSDASGGSLFGIFDEGVWTVVAQDPSPGSRLRRGDSVRLDVDRQ
jgi:PASTA domain-containing protein